MQTIKISLESYNRMHERCKQGKHRWRSNLYGSWCTVCGLYSGIYIGAERSNPEVSIIVENHPELGKIIG